MKIVRTNKTINLIDKVLTLRISTVVMIANEPRDMPMLSNAIKNSGKKLQTNYQRRIVSVLKLISLRFPQIQFFDQLLPGILEDVSLKRIVVVAT